MDPTTEALLRNAPKSRSAFVDETVNAANRYGIPPELLLRTFHQESGFNPASTSGAGAIGVAQLMPGTAKQLGVDPYDPMQNIDGGARYLAEMMKQFGGDHKLALAAYNAGPRRVQQFLRGAGGLPAETRNYVSAITNGGRWSPAAAAAAASAPLPARPVHTEQIQVAPEQTPPGLLQIPGM